MIYEVIVDISNSQVDRVFDYRGEGYEIGCRVEVPFGSKRIEGFIAENCLNCAVLCERNTICGRWTL